MCRPLFFCLMFLLFLPAVAHSALKAKGSVDVAEAWNPAPASGDIILPMPCDLHMVFRIIGVPAKGFLWDMTTRFGKDDSSTNRAYYDSRYTTALAAPFALADVPAPWRANAPTGEYRYYLMGKYEVSGLQWRALMDASCPTGGLNTSDAQPKTEISWYDAIAFSQKYTEWLLKNHPTAVPRFAGDERNVGFLRLPTEAEWEYAARGGHATPTQWLQEEDFFPLAAGTSVKDYAVYRPEDAARIEESTARIGSRKANPAGLHDTSGNAAEMVMDVFRFSLGGRLHGSAGGFIRKGGSYLSGTAEIMPGRREEVAFFLQNGPVRTRDLGMRLVISGINTPGGNRPNTLQSEWKKAGEDHALLLDNTRNPLEELDRLLGMARSDAERENLQRLRNIIKDNNIALERQQHLATEALVRTAAFTIETIRNFAIRRKAADEAVKTMEGRYKKLTSTPLQEEIDMLSRAKNARDNFDRGVNQSLSFYQSRLQDTRQIQPAIMDAALANVEKDLGQGDEFSRKLQDNARMYREHILATRKGQTPDKARLSNDIIPPKK